MKIRPLDDRIVAEVIEAEEKTAGGIVLPDAAKEKPMQAKVVAVGPGRMLDDGTRADICVKKGDSVLYGKYSGTEVTVEGEDLLILKESDILAKMD